MDTALLLPALLAHTTAPQLTDAHWTALRRAGATILAGLHDSWRFPSYVYDRQYGVFPTAPAHVRRVMACLLAIRCGFPDADTMLAHYREDTPYDLVDTYIEFIDGTAHRVDEDGAYTATWASLTAVERLALGPVNYLYDLPC